MSISKEVKLLISASIIVVILIGSYFGYSYYLAPKEEEPSAEETLSIAMTTMVSRLDPHTIHATAEASRFVDIYGKLCEFKPESAELKPALATDWSVSSDALTWTFNLREGVKFHDGTPFNATAVKFNIDRLFEVGLGAAISYFQTLDEVKIVDTYTVQFKLLSPCAFFPQLMAARWSSIIASPTDIKAHYTSEDPLATEYFIDHGAAGTGPYMFKSYEREVRMILEKFPDYWEGWEGKHFDTIIFEVVREFSTGRWLLERGEVDMIERCSPEYYKALNDTEGIMVRVFTNWPRKIQTFGFNSDPTATHVVPKKVRQAISYALSYDTIIDDLALGYPSPMLDLGLNAVTGEPTIPEKMYYPGDVEKAKQLLAEAGYPNGEGLPTYTIMFSSGHVELQALSEQIQADVAKIGINLEIFSAPSAVYKKYLADKTIQPEISSLWYSFDYPDPNALFYESYKSELACPYGWNVARFNNSRVDELLEAGLLEPDTDKRMEMYREIQDIIVEEAPYLFVYIGPEEKVMRDNIKGFEYQVFLSHRAFSCYPMYREAP